MINYDYPHETNQKYWIKTLWYECKVCGCKFNVDLPYDNDLVKLIEKSGTQVKWLPTYGFGGYLDLAKKLAPQFNGQEFTDVVSMKISKIMKLELHKYTEKGILGNGFIVGGYEHICPNCKSKELNCINEKVVEDPKLDWVKISEDLLK
ncbi:MAG: hypothetical protein PHD60_06110 [Clostridia bacterium]|nr:hypothetical protein [Clostridia bacterium]